MQCFEFIYFHCYLEERLVPDSESILSTLLEWGSDLQDVKFYLRRREEAPPFRQVANGKIRLTVIHPLVLRERRKQ